MRRRRAEAFWRWIPRARARLALALAVLAGLLALFWTAVAGADADDQAPVQPVTVPAEQTRVDPSTHVTLLTTAAADCDLACAQSAKRIGLFHRYRGANDVRLGYTDDVVWLHLRISGAEEAIAERYHLTIDYPVLDDVRLYSLTAAGESTMLRAGDRVPRSDWALDRRIPTFPVRVTPGTTTDIYLRVVTSGSMQVPLRIGQPEALQAERTRAAHVAGLVYGAIIAVGLYNALLFISLREWVYFYFIGLVASIGVFILALNGHGYAFLWGDHTGINDIALLSSVGVGVVAGLRFNRAFFLDHLEMVRARPLFTALEAAAAILLIGLFILPQEWLSRFATLLVPLSFVAILVTAVWAWTEGREQARLFVPGWSLLTAAVVLFVVQAVGWWSGSPAVNSAQEPLIAAHVIVISLALAYRLRVLQQENVRLERESAANLERQVAEHTRDLEQARAELAGLNRRLDESNRIDPLTGLYNRREVDARLEAAHRRTVDSGEPFAVALLDIDDFKAVNDHHGHRVGDRILQRVSQRLSNCLPSERAWLGRYGGEELVLFLPAGYVAESAALVEHMREGVAELGTLTGAGTIQVTISVGLTVCEPGTVGDSLQTVLNRADEAVYRAKAGGKNCVVRL